MRASTRRANGPISAQSSVELEARFGGPAKYSSSSRRTGRARRGASTIRGETACARAPRPSPPRSPPGRPGARARACSAPRAGPRRGSRACRRRRQRAPRAAIRSLRRAAAAAALPLARRARRRAPRSARSICLSSASTLIPIPPFSAWQDPRAAIAAPPPPSSRSRPRSRGARDRRRSAARPPSAGVRAACRPRATAALVPVARQPRCTRRSSVSDLRHRPAPARARARCASSALRCAIVSTHARSVRVLAQARVGAQRRDEGLLEAVLGLARADRRHQDSATRPRGSRRGRPGRGGVLALTAPV